jgi:hypothetical protein
VQRIKLFKGLESDLASLEAEINGWIEDNDAKVVNMFGNIAPQTPGAGSSASRQFTPSDVMISVVYETG